MTTIRFSCVDTEILSEPIMNAFEFRKDRKHHWLQRLCLSILRRIGCYSMAKMPRYTVKSIGCKSLMDLIHEQVNEYERRHGNRATHVVIGRTAMQELSGEMWNGSFCFGPMPIHEGTVLGMRIIYVPWHDGITVLPADAFKAS